MEIVWHGEFLPGIVLYGLRSRHGSSYACAEGLPDWAEAEQSLLYGEAWEVQMCDVHVLRWPSQAEFVEFLQTELRRLIAAGCLVAWVDFGYNFADPPSLFLRDTMPGAINAAMTADGRFWNAIDLDRPYDALPDDMLDLLRAASGGLAESE